MPHCQSTASLQVAVLKGMIAAISGALELRDEFTAHHQRNVAHICDRMAAALNLGEFERTGLVFGALLHDIGKLSLPSSLLGKHGRVDASEYAQLKTHSEAGADLLRHLDLPWPIRDMIEQHHERFDGSGYPHGLVREQIYEGARFIAIADTYDSAPAPQASSAVVLSAGHSMMA